MRRILHTLLCFAAVTVAAWADPPGLVGRLSYISGSVTFFPAAGSAWQAAMLNYPLTTGNMLATADASRAEIQIGSASMQLSQGTSISFDSLDYQTVQLRLDKGLVSVRLHNLAAGQTFLVNLPTASVSLSAPGLYRFQQRSDGTVTIVTRSGNAQVTGGVTSFQVYSGQAADIPGSNAAAYKITAAPPSDQWDAWVAGRNSMQSGAASTAYVSSQMEGVSDLDEYGTWNVVAGYGPVWFPAVVPVGWAPYTLGTWIWIDPWGWTWVDYEPWGFAPFHYGRWALVGAVWGWVPGPIVRQPVYAPALVTWVGGTPLRGTPPSQGGISWAPLGPRQVFHPMYTASTSYVRAVNGTAILPSRGSISSVEGPAFDQPQRSTSAWPFHDRQPNGAFMDSGARQVAPTFPHNVAPRYRPQPEYQQPPWYPQGQPIQGGVASAPYRRR